MCDGSTCKCWRATLTRPPFDSATTESMVTSIMRMYAIRIFMMRMHAMQIHAMRMCDARPMHATKIHAMRLILKCIMIQQQTCCRRRFVSSSSASYPFSLASTATPPRSPASIRTVATNKQVKTPYVSRLGGSKGTAGWNEACG